MLARTTGMTYFIRLGNLKVILDQLLAAEGRFEVAKGCPTAKCDHCEKDITATGTLYGIPGEEGGATVLCDELNGGCETQHPVEQEDAIYFPEVLVTDHGMSEEMRQHMQRQAEGRVRRGSSPLIVVECRLSDPPRSLADVIADKMGQQKIITEIELPGWCPECGNNINGDGMGHKLDCSWR